MKTLQKFGGFSALFLAVAYLIGIVLFLCVLDYPSITDIAQKAALLVENQGVMFSTNLIMYVLFGIFLIVLSLAFVRPFEVPRTGYYAGGNRDWPHLGWLTNCQRYGLERRNRPRGRALCQRPDPGCVSVAGD